LGQDVSDPDHRLGELLDAIAEGDRSALEHLYKATSDKLYGVVLRILRKPELAAQALPAAYLRIWRDALNFTPALLSAESWLVMHARRTALDMARDRPELGHEEMAESAAQAAETEDPETGGDIGDELKQLLACLATLSADPRLMVLLAYFDGWSRSELAVEFDAPAPTIRTWMLRGLEQIRDCASQ
jgi:RNA polymerase sigma-70 factor (ECF subfamily)